MNIGQKLVIRVKSQKTDSIESVKSQDMIQIDTKPAHSQKPVNKTAKKKKTVKNL